MTNKITEVLRGVFDLLSDPDKWTDGRLAADGLTGETDPTAPDAVAWCVHGAAKKVAYDLGYNNSQDYTALAMFIDRVADERYDDVDAVDGVYINDILGYETLMEEFLPWAIKDSEDPEKIEKFEKEL